MISTEIEAQIREQLTIGLSIRKIATLVEVAPGTVMRVKAATA
jgi:hypothetical protein